MITAKNIKRREFLKLGAAVSAIGVAASPADAQSNTLSGCKQLSSSTRKLPWTKALFVPGYWPNEAFTQAESVVFHPDMSRGVPIDYDGPVRMLTRFGHDGSIMQAAYPVFGHDVEISSDGKYGFYGSLEYDSYVSFDPDNLDVIALAKPVEENWIGGGHGLFLNDSKLIISERAPKVGYLGEPEKHFGCITIRDPATMKILERYSTHGISPHDVRLLKDGKHLAISNYGSTFPKGKKQYGLPRHIIEPAVTIIDINSGKLVDKIMSNSTTRELRHICAIDLDNIFAIQTEMREPDELQTFHADDTLAYEGDNTARNDYNYFPAPTLFKNAVSQSLEEIGDSDLHKFMRHGLSIHHEPIHDEVIATYPSSHSVMIFDAASGELKRRIDGSKIGLDYPCGLTMLPDPNYYAVTGFWKNLYIFERGTHRIIREMCQYNTFFGHSHITAV